LRTSTAWFAFAISLSLSHLAPAADPGPLLATIKAVGKEGAGNVAASRALRKLIPLGPDVLLDVLAAFDDASPVAANWLRAAVDTIADREVATGRPLPTDNLEAFVKDTRHDGAARRLSYEWLERVDATAPQRLLPGMLDDPGQELRRNAVGAALGEAQKLLDRGEREVATSALRRVFTSARDVDQVERIARQLADLGAPVDLAAHLGFVRRWHLLGPFDNCDGKGFNVAFDPERGAPAGGTLIGQEFMTSDSPGQMDPNKLARVDLNAVIGKHKGAVAYAFAAIESPREQAVEIRAGSPNALKLFLNGKEIYSCEEYHHNGRLDTHVAHCVLREGRNEILVKVCQNEQTEEWAQEWSFQVRICDALGGAMPFTIPAAAPVAGEQARGTIAWWPGRALAVTGLLVALLWVRKRSRKVKFQSVLARTSFLLLCTSLLVPSPSLIAGDWPQFRGPGSTGVGDEVGLPVEWSIERDRDTGAITSSKHVRWVVDLPGRGLSNPVIAGDRVYVTACSGYRQTRLRVLCYDSSSGNKLWERQFAATGNTACQAATCMAAPTPVTDGSHVWALFASGDLVCLDREGHLQWYRSLVGDYQAITNTTGMAASPVLWRDVLIVPMENAGESFAAGIDAQTGINRWKIERSRANNWVTPLLLTRGERDEVLLQSAAELSAHDPATGAKRWRYKGNNLATMPSPTASGGVIFVPGEELIALKPGSDSTAPEVLWRIGRLAPRNASPLVYRDRVYILNSAGVLSCADVASGKLHWQQRLRGGFWASPVAADGKVYCVSETGTIFVLAGGGGEVLGTNALGETIFATPALAAGAVFLRSDQHLYCFSEKER
jgi:outer membrane protein assembly factor BamB